MISEQQSNKKSIIYVILLVLILFIVSGIWYVKQSKAERAFSYQDVVYNCEETGGTATDDGTIIKIAQADGGVPMIVHQGKEYKCAIVSNGSKTPDVVLNKTTDNVKVFLSDNKGNDVEVKDGSVKIGADGNAVVIDKSGVSVKLGGGGIIEVSEEGNVNVNIPGAGSVKVEGEDVETNIPGAGSVKVEGETTEINISEIGNIEVDEEGEVSIPGIDIPDEE